MTRPFRWLTGLVAATVTALTLVLPATGAAAATGTDPEFHAVLHGSSAFPNTRGHSEYERTTRQREVEVTVNNAPSRLRGHWVVVYVNLKRVGSMRVNSRGHAEREWSTEHGQFVPWAGSGSPVRVRRSSNNQLVVSGTYHRAAD
jgi:hypothetical protein